MTDWRPGATLQRLQERARLNATLREFFSARGVLEVETPLLCSSTASDIHLHSFAVVAMNEKRGRSGFLANEQTTPPFFFGAEKYLQTSPEFAMKRLLAAGSGPIYQLCKAFRAGDEGSRHNPEFTMLEWYRPGWSLQELMAEVDALLRVVLPGNAFAQPAEHLTYRAVFEQRFAINPHGASLETLQRLVAAHTSYGNWAELDSTACLDLLFSLVIEPELGRHGPVFIHEYPAEQAALAQVQINGEGDRVAMRCEVYLRGMELANAYLELTDAAEQRQRMLADAASRHTSGLPLIPFDERFLAALDGGLPACAGVALGVDRLLMLRCGATSLDEVLAFSHHRI